jgi:hypothetical protein
MELKNKITKGRALSLGLFYAPFGALDFLRPYAPFGAPDFFAIMRHLALFSPL